MSSTRLFKMSAVAAIAICMASAVAAQGGPRGERGWGWGMWGGNGPGSGWGMGMMWGRGPWGRGPDWMLERIEGRLAFMKTEIKITEAQTPAWTQLADAIRTAAKHHNERMKALLAGEPKTLLERVDAQEQFMSVRLEEIKLTKAALKNLYDMLSQDQKKDADELGIPMVGMGGPWNGGGMMGGPWN